MIKLGIKIIILVFAFGIAFSYLSMIKNDFSEKKFLSVDIAGIEVAAEIADTPEKRALGLSGREELRENEGMIFIFPEEGHRQFWMKEMNFALDIIWLGEDKKVIDITKGARPESYPERFSPSMPAKYVLEVNSGFADRHKIKIGDYAEF